MPGALPASLSRVARSGSPARRRRRRSQSGSSSDGGGSVRAPAGTLISRTRFSKPRRRADEEHPAAVGSRPCSGAGSRAGRTRSRPRCASIVVSPTSRVTLPSRIQNASSSRWWTWSGAFRPGRLRHLDDRELSAGVGARRPDHGERSEPPARLTLVAPHRHRGEGCHVGLLRHRSSLSLSEERDRVPPCAVAPAAHDADAPCRDDERRVARLQRPDAGRRRTCARAATSRSHGARSRRRPAPAARRPRARRRPRTTGRERRGRGSRRRPRAASRAPPVSALQASCRPR